MKRRFWLSGAVLGAWSALAVIALTYLGHRLAGLPFLPFDLFDWMARVLPGTVVRSGIEGMIRVIRTLHLGPTSAVAKTAEQLLALAQFLIGGAVLGLLLVLLSARFHRHPTRAGALVGLIVFLAATGAESAVSFGAAGGGGPGAVIAILWLALVLAGWGAVLGRALQIPRSRPEEGMEMDASRRRFLYLTGVGSFTVVVAGLAVRILSREEGTPTASAAEVLRTAADSSARILRASSEVLAGRFSPVPGTRKELTSNKDFYRVDIDASPPRIDAGSWKCEVGGLVQRPLTLSLDDLRARPAASQAVTQECISNPVGGDLISTTVYSGVRLRDLLAEAGLKPGAEAVAIESFDGYYESVPMVEAQDERTLLAYAMNEEPLPAEHGFPLRLCIPNHYGMKQPKWIRSLHVIDHQGAGYWVDRGWSRSAIVRTTSVIDAVDTSGMDPSTRVVPVGGIAFAGSRGISGVEIQVDDGPWNAVELRVPALSPLTWVQWRYLWPATEGRHTLRVRATDGNGTLQESKENGSFPDGATGLYSVKKSVRS